MIPLSFIGYNLKYLLDSISMLWVILISGQNAKNICCRAHQDAFKPFSLAQRPWERERFFFLSSQHLMIQISGLGLTINCFFLSQLMSDTAENSSRWKWTEFIICEMSEVITRKGLTNQLGWTCFLWCPRQHKKLYPSLTSNWFYSFSYKKEH